jgi:hypothetical protein
MLLEEKISDDDFSRMFQDYKIKKTSLEKELQDGFRCDV